MCGCVHACIFWTGLADDADGDVAAAADDASAVDVEDAAVDDVDLILLITLKTSQNGSSSEAACGALRPPAPPPGAVPAVADVPGDEAALPHRQAHPQPQEQPRQPRKL